MRPDLSRDLVTGWSTLGGTALVVILTVWLLSDGGSLSEQVDKAVADQAKITGKDDLQTRVTAQIEANTALRRTIEELKNHSGFSIESRFVIPADAKQPAAVYRDRFIEVRQALREKAGPKSVSYKEDIGFPSVAELPDDSEAPYLMAILQLTDKAVSIALDTPTPLVSLEINHRDPAVETGPESRPVLLKEYPLELKVRGGLKDILWILHRLSQVEPGGKDYPLILRGLVVQSDNAKPKDDIAQLDATFQIAGMQFMSEEQRLKDPRKPMARAIGGGGSGGSAGKPVFTARP